jgi:hypothetical protein
VSKKLTTIGGFLASNGCSRHTQHYGRAADTVLELEIMDGTGKFFTITKNIQDYLGNEGSIFVILRAKLKVIAIGERSLDIRYFDTVQEAVSFSQSTKALQPLSIEFLDAAAATYAGFNTKHTVIVEWEGLRGALQYEQYAAALHKWEATRKLLGQQGYLIIEDSTIAADGVVEAIEWCRQKELPVIAHLGLGIVHPYLKRQQEKLRDEWCAFLEQRNQSPVGEFGYGVRKKKYVPNTLKNKIRVLKERHDYNNTLGRGKLYDYV